MSIISPFTQNSVITLYKGIQWDNTYSDIRWFSNATERNTFLQSHYVNSWQSCAIVKNGISIKLTGQQPDYMVCNYMSFTNGEFGNQKTYYAFIKSVNYININTFEIVYEIDWVQSYLFDIVFESCFVEKEHVNDDTFGKNLVPENIAIGEYAIEYVKNETYQHGMIAMFLTEGSTSVDLQTYAGVVIGTDISVAREGNFGSIEAQLQQLNVNGESEKVVQLCMCTNEMAESPVSGMHETFNVAPADKTFTFGQTSYIAKNNKMMTYPFKLLTIDNFEGSVEQYRYEEFADTACSFAVEGTCVPKPCMICFPINYKGWQGNSQTPNTCQQFSVMFTNFPEIPWTSDTFRAWVSQNSATLIGDSVAKVVQTVGGALSLGGGLMTGNIGLIGAGATQVASGVQGLAEINQNIQNHQIHGSQLQGSIPSAGMSYMRNTVGFRATKYCLMPEDAERIDLIMSRYGYQVNAVKVPNITGRQYVNYVKTRNAHVKGNIPVDTKDLLEAAMNGGCSFWHVDDIGMQITNNPIIGVN